MVKRFLRVYGVSYEPELALDTLVLQAFEVDGLQWHWLSLGKPTNSKFLVQLLLQAQHFQ